jgi:FlaA1/EpsC-like NDP-sugar epimerase
VDDDPEKWGRGIHGVSIFGGREVIPALARQEIMDEIVIAIPSLEGEEREDLVALCQATGKVTRIMQRVSSTFLN